MSKNMTKRDARKAINEARADKQRIMLMTMTHDEKAKFIIAEEERAKLTKSVRKYHRKARRAEKNAVKAEGCSVTIANDIKSIKKRSKRLSYASTKNRKDEELLRQRRDGLVSSILELFAPYIRNQMERIQEQSGSYRFDGVCVEMLEPALVPVFVEDRDNLRIINEKIEEVESKQYSIATRQGELYRNKQQVKMYAKTNHTSCDNAVRMYLDNQLPVTMRGIIMGYLGSKSSMGTQPWGTLNTPKEQEIIDIRKARHAACNAEMLSRTDNGMVVFTRNVEDRIECDLRELQTTRHVSTFDTTLLQGLSRTKLDLDVRRMNDMEARRIISDAVANERNNHWFLEHQAQKHKQHSRLRSRITRDA
jgi:hypothetical protein